LREAFATKQSRLSSCLLDCFAEPGIGRAFAPPVGSQRRGTDLSPGQSGKHRFRGMGDHGEQRSRRAARGAFALLPVSDGLDRHPSRAANSSCVSRARRRRSRTAGAGTAFSGAPPGSAGASGNSHPSRNSTIRPSAFSRKRCMFSPKDGSSGADHRKCALRFG
jgi:hypothetical protein